MNIKDLVSNALVLVKNHGLRNQLNTELRNLGITIAKSTGIGQSTFDELINNEFLCEVIFSDVKLNDMSAATFITHLRKEPQFNNMHIFIFYDENELGEVLEIVPSGISGLIKKPLKKDFLGKELLSRFGKFLLYQRNFSCLHRDTIAQFFESQRQNQNALKFYEEISQMQPCAQNYFDIGRIASLLNNDEKAKTAFEQAIITDENYRPVIQKYLSKLIKDKNTKTTVSKIPQQVIDLFYVPFENIKKGFYGQSFVQKTLVIGGNHQERVQIKSILAHYDLKNCQMTASGEEAFNMINSQSIDVVFLNLQLADMNGLQFLDALHKNFSHQKPLIILLVDESLYDNLFQAINLGIDGVVVKPLTMDNLIQAIHITLLQDHMTCESQAGAVFLKNAYYLQKFGKLAEAKEQAMQAVRLNSKDAVSAFYLASILHQIGEVEESKIWYKIAVDNNERLRPLCQITVKLNEQQRVNNKLAEELALTVLSEKDSIENENKDTLEETASDLQIEFEEDISEVGEIEEKPSDDNFLQVSDTSSSLLSKIEIPILEDLSINNSSVEIDKNIELQKNLLQNDAKEENVGQEIFASPINLTFDNLDTSDPIPQLSMEVAPRNEVENKPKNGFVPDNKKVSKFLDNNIQKPEPQDRDVTYFSGQLIETINGLNNSIDEVDIDPKQMFSAQAIKFVDKKLSDLSKDHILQAFSLGVTPASLPQINNVEQIFANEGVNVNLGNQQTVRVLGSEITEWMPNLKFKKFADEFGIAYNSMKDFADLSSTNHKKVVDNALHLINQSRLFHSRLQLDSHDQDYTVQEDSYLKTLGKIFSSDEMFSALVNSAEIPKDIHALITKASHKQSEDLYEKLGKKIVASEYYDKFLNTAHNALTYSLEYPDIANQDDPPYTIRQIKMLEDALYQLRPETVKLHDDYLKGKKSFSDSVPYIMQQVKENPKGVYQLAYESLKTDHFSLESFKTMYASLKNTDVKQDVLKKLTRQFMNKHLNDKKTNFALADYFIAIKEYDNAISLLERLIKKTKPPELVFYLRKLAMLTFKHKKFKESIYWSHKVISHVQGDEDSFNMIGIANKKMERLKDSIKSYEKGIKFNPDSYKLHYNLAIALANYGLDERSQSILQKAKRLKKN